LGARLDHRRVPQRLATPRALEITAEADKLLADEYDAAQDRGEVGQSGGRTDLVPNVNEVPPTAAELGLTGKQIHDARQVHDAEGAPALWTGTPQDNTPSVSRAAAAGRAALHCGRGYLRPVNGRSFGAAARAPIEGVTALTFFDIDKSVHRALGEVLGVEGG
jgi:hypothetical protein